MIIFLEMPNLAYYSALALDEMTPQEAVALACARLGVSTLPAELAALIQTKAQGHPFFVEEIVNTLRDSQVIKVKENQVVIQRGLAQIELPDTVQGVVQARLDRLDEPTHLTLKVASVIGRTFSYDILRGVHPASLSDADLREQLEHSRQLDITPLERPEPELCYIFKHAITQEVAYQTMTFAQRRQLHRAVAGWCKQHASPEAPGYALLTHHYHCAGDVERERQYARLAGERAAAQYANAEAVRYLSRALELTPEDDASARYALLLAREKVYDLQSERDLERQDIAALEQLAKRLNDDFRQAEAALRRANLAFAICDYPAAIASAWAAIGLAQSTQNIRLEAEGLLQVGQALWQQGEYAAAQVQLDQAVARLLSSDLEAAARHTLTHLYSRRGALYIYRGIYEKALADLQQALSISRELGDRFGQAQALADLGIVSINQGDYNQAQAYLEHALLIRQQVGDRSGEGIVLNNLAFILTSQHKYEQAQTHCEQSVRIAQAIGNRRGEYNALGSLGDIAALTGDYAAAISWMEHALLICREIGDRWGESVSLAHLGYCYHQMGDSQTGEHYIRQALQTDPNPARLYTRAATFLAHVLAAQGRLAEAAELYQQVLDCQLAANTSYQVLDVLAGLARVRTPPQPYVEEILARLEAAEPARALIGAEEPMQVYLTCYQVLHASGDPRAGHILGAAYNLLQDWAARITDEGMRRSFLENVAAHREIVAAWLAAPFAPRVEP